MCIARLCAMSSLSLAFSHMSKIVSKIVRNIMFCISFVILGGEIGRREAAFKENA